MAWTGNNLPMVVRDATRQDWHATLQSSYSIHNVVAMRSELPFYLIRWDGASDLEWMELSDPHYRVEPFHFEIYFGKEAQRDTHYLSALKAAARSKAVVARQIFGFWDLFYALPADRERRTFLFAGQFLREQPTWDLLSQSWQELTGQGPTSGNADFVQYVRMALSLPVLEREIFGAVRDFVKKYAAYLAGEKGDRLRRQVEALNKDYFTRLWPITEWIDSVISPDKFQLPPWYYEGKLTSWVREALGINRLPTTVLALMPLDARNEPQDPVRVLIRNVQIQRQCIAFSRDMPETAVTKLSDYGLSIITSCRRGNNPAALRSELRDRAQRFRVFIRERFRLDSVVGIGRTMARGESLSASHRDAVLSLHMCVQLGKDVLFHDEIGGAEQVRYVDLQRASRELVEALDHHSATELKLKSDRYVRMTLLYGSGRIEVVRSQFLSLLVQLVHVVERRNPMRKDVCETFAETLTAGLEQAASQNQLLESFNQALQRLSFISSATWRGPRAMRLEATLQYLQENFAEPLPLPQVARRAGFSVPVFTRVFKETTGSSFLVYLRSIRIGHAKSFLTSTRMNAEQIAQECGLHSQHHLVRAFKKVVGTTPGAYRKAHSGRFEES